MLSSLARGSMAYALKGGKVWSISIIYQTLYFDPISDILYLAGYNNLNELLPCHGVT